MKDYYRNLFEFNEWANSVLIDHIISLDNVPEKTALLISHIIAAQDLWFERVNKNKEHSISIWDELSLQECKILSEQSTKRWLNFIKRISEKGLDEKISYFSVKGIHFENTLSDIITQLINHGSYHRGQVNQLLSTTGKEPLEIDYINYIRQSG